MFDFWEDFSDFRQDLFDGFPEDVYLSCHYGDDRCILRFGGNTDELIKMKQAEIQEIFDEYLKNK